MITSLYKLDLNGKCRIWTIEVQGNAYRTTSGLVDGEKVTSEWSYAHGKNTGKKNETSDEEQALRVAETLIRIRKEQGCYENIEDAGKGKAFFQPMLAAKWTNRKSAVEFPVIVQQKLDGCVSGDTLISTDKGDISMRDVVEKGVGTLVWSYNLKTHKKELKPILGRFKDSEDIQEVCPKWFKVVLSDGREVQLTGNHRVYLPELRCWRRVDELSTGDEVLSI